jgi:hypothetical protein
MANTLDQAYVSQFSDNIHLLVREGGSKLLGLFATETARGEKHFFERLGKLTVSQITSRLQATNLQDAPHSRRMATIKRFEGAIALDKLDQLQMLIDPTSEYSKELARAHGANFDAEIYASMLGTAATGKDGTGSQAFDTAGQQIAHGSAGLTVAKLNQAIRIIQANEIDTDSTPLYLTCSAWALEDLLSDSTNQLTSFDYQDSKVMSTGGLPKFRGVSILRTERVPDSSAGVTRRALLFTRNTMKIAMPEAMEVKMGEDVTRNFAPVVGTYMSFGSVRMEEDTVVDVLFQ